MAMDTPAVNEVEQKLTAARTRLILEKPFLGALVLRLPLTAADPAWCPTTATDARALFYNHSYINELSFSQVQFVLAHEALHCGLSHFARREHRDRKRWDIACDYAVNQLLSEDNLEAPDGALFDEIYVGMTAEEIYPCIDSDTDEEPLDKHLYDNNQSDSGDPASDDGKTDDPELNPDLNPDPNPELNNDTTTDESDVTDQTSDASDGMPGPLTGAERDRLDTQWQQRLVGAAQQAAMAGKLSESVARMLERLLQPTVPWRAQLARFMGSTARIDYNLSRPSQRRETDAIFPSLHTRHVDVVVAIDTSGSIKAPEFDAFLSELNAIKGAVNARVTLLACDARLDNACPWIFEPWQPLLLPPQLQGGGATDFSPVFDWVANNILKPDLLIYFTDARGRFPERQPSFPTLWLVKGGENTPWGQRIQLN